MFIFNQKQILLFPSNEISDLLRRVFLCIGEKTAVFFFCFEILIILTAMMSRMTFAKIFFFSIFNGEFLTWLIGLLFSSLVLF